MAQPSFVRCRTTRAEIDLDALSHNLRVVRDHAGGARVFGVIKADGYGHGLTQVARELVASGADGLAVALVEEGLALRAAGVAAPILVLNGLYGDGHDAVVEAGLTPCVYDDADAAAFAARGVGVHVKVDTGMTRLGVRDLDAFLGRHPRLRIEGLMTHLADAERDPAATDAQLDAFDAAIARVRAQGHAPMRHAANSAGALLRPRSRYDLVRAGVALYGVRPTPDALLDLRPVMRLIAPVARVAEIPPGTAVGYGRTWTSRRPSRIATIALGYGDGYLRALSNVGHAVVGGVRCPLAGRVSMDLIGVDVTDAPSVARGDEAVLIGPELRAEEVAEAAGTIAYEVLSGVSPRVPRIYRGGSSG